MTKTTEKLIKQVKHDVRCGLHSGFRPCCIAWFTGPWQLVYRYTPRLGRVYFGVIDGLQGTVQYVCCPLCLLLDRKPVEVMKCKPPEKWEPGRCTPTGEKLEKYTRVLVCVK